jgi:hypothetical protein
MRAASEIRSTVRRRRAPWAAAVRVATAVLVGAAVLAGCDAGSSSAGRSPASGGNRTTGGQATAPCPVGRWAVSAQQEFADLGLGGLAGGGVSVTGGTVRVEFGADHSYTFSYDGVRLSVGGGAGSATVTGPVTGTWQLSGDRLSTTVGTSGVAVDVRVAGVTVTPSENLNAALRAGLPSTATVTCGGGSLVATATSGAASGRKVTFAAG